MTEVPYWKPLLLVAAASAVLWGSGGETPAFPPSEVAMQADEGAWPTDGAEFPQRVHAVSRPS